VATTACERMDFRFCEFSDARHDVLSLRIDDTISAECARQLRLKRILGDNRYATGGLYGFERSHSHQANCTGADDHDELSLKRRIVQHCAQADRKWFDQRSFIIIDDIGHKMQPMSCGHKIFSPPTAGITTSSNQKAGLETSLGEMFA
jgi:hypothetical protein